MKTEDHNSTVNQGIKGQFVGQHVKACFSYEMESILRASAEGLGSKEYPLAYYDDIENLYFRTCPNCGSTNTSNFSGGDKCNDCEHMASHFENEPQEIFEWWIVSEYLYSRLKNHGEPVLEWGNNYYWGRGTSGQAILLDSVISSICDEMEILDGQKYSWAK